MSASLKPKAPVTPTPFQSPERAALAHAIAALADADARKAAIAQAAQTADAEVRAARRAVEATTEAIETARANAAKHLTDRALGTAGEAPVSIRQARAEAIEAADNLEACLAAQGALQSERVDAHGLAGLKVQDAAVAVLSAEMAGRGAAMAAQVAQLQKELVARGSALEWLSRAGAFPQVNGKPANDGINRTVWRMDSTPRQWILRDGPGALPFAEPTGAQRWRAAFEQLKLDATTALPED